MQKTAKSGVFLRISKVESADVFVGFLICFVVFFRLISWL